MQVSRDLTLTCSSLPYDTNGAQLYLLQLEITSDTSLNSHREFQLHPWSLGKSLGKRLGIPICHWDKAQEPV